VASPPFQDPHGATVTHRPGGDGDPLAGLVLVVSAESGVSAVPIATTRAVTFGRGADADVTVVDQSVSRRHAMLRFEPEIALEDLGSTNGTIVHGRRLTPGERAPITIGSVFEIGRATVLLQRARELVQMTPASARAAEDTVADPTMLRLYALLDAVAPTRLPILILGETGVGKDVFAAAAHARSPRASAPLVKLNCAAISESLMESELFGYERGAFTGADRAKPGFFEAAHGGTLFLDEIGEMPLATQAKLLRVLESGEVMRLGSLAPTTVDVRVISATNRDPRRLVAEQRFRADLFFRLNGISIAVPPLRARTGDIALLARLFARRAAEKLGRAAPALAPSALRALEAYGWPGNVRELRNVIDRAVALAGGAATLEASHLLLGDEPTLEEPSADAATLRQEKESFEKQRVLDALAQTGGNQTKAAALLGVSRRTLVYKLEAFGVARPRKRK